jgi:hypothetical protein
VESWETGASDLTYITSFKIKKEKSNYENSKEKE